MHPFLGASLMNCPLGPALGECGDFQVGPSFHHHLTPGSRGENPSGLTFEIPSCGKIFSLNPKMWFGDTCQVYHEPLSFLLIIPIVHILIAHRIPYLLGFSGIR